MDKTTPLGIKKLSNWKMVLSTFLSELKQVDYLALKASESLLSFETRSLFLMDGEEEHRKVSHCRCCLQLSECEPHGPKQTPFLYGVEMMKL